MSVPKRVTASGPAVPFSAVVTGVNLEGGTSVTLRTGGASGPIFAVVTVPGTVQLLPRVRADGGVYVELVGDAATVYHE